MEAIRIRLPEPLAANVRELAIRRFREESRMLRELILAGLKAGMPPEPPPEELGETVMMATNLPEDLADDLREVALQRYGPSSTNRLLRELIAIGLPVLWR